jgi:endogenous inhibitor of DNA gyrase (YacG/DUF329 family)
MPKATDQYNLGVINPGLAKEWHPSRNGDLNPRNVSPGSGKKVWWICISGHEWEAPIYSRSRGTGCPVCNKPTATDSNESLITNTDLLKEWHLTKNSGLNLRNLPAGFNEKVWWICEEGHEWQATVKSRMNGRGCPDCNKHVRRKSASRMHKLSLRVILEDANSGYWSYAQTKDLSNDGMLLESEVAFKPGTKINIKFDTQPFKSAPKIYSSVVRWCKEVADEESSHTYGIGVKFT